MGMPARWNPATVADEERSNRYCQDARFRAVQAIEPRHLMVFENEPRQLRKYRDFDYSLPS
jgi:hypothetical protein